MRAFFGGKVCNVILDGGSSENIVSKEVVEKLKRPIKKHPHPYKVAWFCRGNEVSARCLIKFTVGNNVEDACHILLGRPWLYDKDMIHHTRVNTYAFKKVTKNLTLQPLKEEATSSSKASKVTGF